MPGFADPVHDASEERPHYRYRQETGTNAFLVVVDEGWRSSVVCSGMYEWAAKWLVAQLQGKPYAPDTRP
jgi:hypothetical protein